MAGVATPSIARLVGRISVAFVLDLAKLSRGPLDMVDGLIVLAIIQANLAPLSRDAELQRTYATYDSPPPDEVRRPVSISGVAASLEMSYETVRRRVAHLAEMGACEITPKGVYVSYRVLDTVEHRAIVDSSYALVHNMYDRLRDLGLFEEIAQASLNMPEARFSDLPVRAVARLWSDYFLRVVETLRKNVGHAAAGMLLFEMLRANTEHLTDEERGADGWDVNDFVPDERRRPVRVVALAARVGVPEETARRLISQLLKDGRCVRVPGGLIISSVVMAAGRLPETMSENLGHLHRMFVGLSQLGVLAQWERGRSSVRGVA